MRSILFKHLSPFGIYIFDDMIYEKEGYYILYRDVLNHAIIEKMDCLDADMLTEKIVGEMKENGALILDSWMAKAENADCSSCPAFKWVIHRDGVHSCRLGFEIDERGKTAKPVKPCLRPQTVGASYVLARELGRPEPMVGKLDKWQYEQYEAEKEAAGC